MVQLDLLDLLGNMEIFQIVILVLLLRTLRSVPFLLRLWCPHISMQLSYSNNWCSISSSSASDSSCVYGSYGPLGESGPLTTASYYNTMYHLNQHTYWYNDYNMNLDSAGVWGTQGPLGVTGALGVLGALGPTGISLQAGMTTTPEGKYLAMSSSGSSTIVRQTQPMRYSHDSSAYRLYDLFEMYSRKYALGMCPGAAASASCEVNDSSFGVDASAVLTQKYYHENDEAASGRDGGDTSGLIVEDGVTAGVNDKYSFASKYNQFVHINLVPYGGTPGLPGQIIGGSWDSLNMTLSLSCGSSSSSKKLLQTTTSNFVSTSSSTTQSDLIPFLTTRLRKNEVCDVSVSLLTPSNKDSNSANDWTGYYLYVTGSGLQTVTQGKINSDPDLWGLRQQADGTSAFNLNGPHQAWIPF
jgi:hypothetical protein